MLSENHKEYPVLLTSVSKSYGTNNMSVNVLSQINFHVNYGELLLITGPSGSGKTTLLSIIAGLIQPNCGDVKLFDFNPVNCSQQKMQSLRANRIGFVFQSFNLLHAVSVLDNVIMSALIAGKSKPEAAVLAMKAIEEVGIDHLIHKKPAQLSQGEKQRVAIARAFINNPELIIADEPTASLESSQGREVIHLLHQYALNQKKSVIVASHDLRLCDYADRVVRLEDGTLNEIDVQEPGLGNTILH